MKWQGLLALKTDQAAVQMYLISGNEEVAKSSLPKNEDGSTPPLRIFQRMRMEPMQIEGVVRKMQVGHLQQLFHWLYTKCLCGKKLILRMVICGFRRKRNTVYLLRCLADLTHKTY